MCVCVCVADELFDVLVSIAGCIPPNVTFFSQVKDCCLLSATQIEMDQGDKNIAIADTEVEGAQVESRTLQQACICTHDYCNNPYLVEGRTKDKCSVKDSVNVVPSNNGDRSRCARHSRILPCILPPILPCILPYLALIWLLFPLGYCL